MKRTLPILALLLPGLLAQAPLAAQAVKVRIKVKADLRQRMDDQTHLISLVKGDEGALVGMKVPARITALGGVPQGDMPWSLVTYSRETLGPIKNAPYKMVYGETPIAIEGLARFQKKLWIFGSKLLPEISSVLLLRQEMNPRSLIGVKGAQDFLTISYDRFLKGPEWFANNTAVGFRSQLSTDSTRLMLQLDPTTTTKAGAPHMSIVVNKDFSLYWTGILQPDASAREVAVMNTLLDEKGTVWHLVKLVTDPAPKVKGQIGYAFSVFRLDSMGQQVVSLDLPGSDYVQDARLELRKSGDLVVAGIYSDPDLRRDQAKGIFFTTLDRGTLAWGPFKTNDLKVNMVGEKKELQVDIGVQDMQVFSDGGIALLADENALRTAQSKNFANQPITRESYVNRDLHIVRLDPSGEPLWYTLVDREMSLESPEGGRSKALVQADQLYVLLNDDLKNEERRKLGEAVPVMEGGGEAMILEFKPDGTTKSRQAYPDDYLVLRPGQQWRIAPNEIAFTGCLKLDGNSPTFPVSVQFEQEAKK
ncbi:MAG: hypothetical protein IPH53_16890 [Flavobacteriales bacterium]|nr:hypothetical protein [Flavobacteriales bacterium]